jgi:hypothetical protein
MLIKNPLFKFKEAISYQRSAISKFFVPACKLTLPHKPQPLSRIMCPGGSAPAAACFAAVLLRERMTITRRRLL